MFVVLSAITGFCVASRGRLDYSALLTMGAGVGLLASGLSALNQFFERKLDARMRRTELRPLPSGKIAPKSALLFGLLLSAAALAVLALAINPLTGLLGVLTLVSYLFVYTPLKTRTTVSTAIGALPGAMPPLLGWAAVHNEVSVGGWVLFAILFLWQFPHFLAIAWMYREDYERAGVKVLPVVEPEGRVTGQQIMAYTLLLLPVSLLPAMMNLAGTVYFVGALLLGVGLLYFSARAARAKTAWQARRLLLASVIYLPALYALLVFAG